MADSSVVSIVALCLSIDQLAADVYSHLAESATGQRLVNLWQEMAQDETVHIAYWRKLLERNKDKPLPPVFEEPDSVMRELEHTAKIILNLKTKSQSTHDIHAAFILAYRLEFYLLHPAFESLFHQLRQEVGGESPEDDYAEHIGRLVDAARELDAVTPESELLTECMSHLWQRNRQLAKELSNVGTLRSLIPICASCKKVRDDKGYWEQVESYVTHRTGVSFSHSVCPECMAKLYGFPKKS